MGHSGSGKTSLTEMLLYLTNMTDRIGKVEEGNTVSDFDSDEIKRKISIYTSTVLCQYKDMQINFLDTPGYFDFAGEVKQACRIADAAVITVCAKAGIEVGTEKAWEYAEERKLPRLFFINKIDAEFADYNKVIKQLKEFYGNKIAPFTIPIKEGDHFNGVVNVLENKARKFVNGKIQECEIPKELKEEIEAVKEMILEAVAETDEELMEKFFAGEAFTDEEIRTGLEKGLKEGTLVPVLCGSSITGTGIPMLLDVIDKEVPTSETIQEEGPTKILIFKTIVDPFIGKLSLFRVYQGILTSEHILYNLNTGAEERIGHLYVLRGKKQIEVKQLTAGQIGAVAKLQKTFTGDTLSIDSNEKKMEAILYPSPSIDLAILPKAKGDEEKISMGLQRLKEEDLTIDVQYNVETHQTIVYGLGEQHIEVVASKLKQKFGIDVELTKPRVAYRETIKSKAKVEGKHKKQTGGHGQYGHVWMEFESLDVSTDLQFEEKIFGGSVPKQYIPAVEKGLKECLVHGVLAGYPVVGLKATLLDGSYHAVDSSEMAFKMATHIAYKKGLMAAKPVLLEPIMQVEIYVPESYTGDIIGDLNKRRGRVIGMDTVQGKQRITAEIPKAEMYKYGVDLRSITQGRGSFTMEFIRYEEVPTNIVQQVIQEQESVG